MAPLHYDQKPNPQCQGHESYLKNFALFFNPSAISAWRLWQGRGLGIKTGNQVSYVFLKYHNMDKEKDFF